MHLLFLEPRPAFGGGSERFTLDLCRYAARKGHGTSLAYAEVGDMIPAYEQVGTRCYQLPVEPWNIRRPIYALKSLLALRSLVTSNRIHLVCTSHLWMGSCLASVGRWSPAKVAMHLGLAIVPSRLNAAGLRALDLRIAPSEHVAEWWRRSSLRSKAITVIPNGVDLTEFSDARSRVDARRGLALSGTAQVVVYVGRVTREKGVFTLVEAFGRYARSGTEAILLIVGPVSASDAIAIRISATVAGLAPHQWRLLAPVSDPSSIYAAADVVVVPSEWDEPFGLVAIEAMACRRVVVVSDRGVLPDLVEPAGPLAVFRAGDVAELTSRLAYWLAHDAERTAAARALRKRAEDEYSIERCGDRYLEEFEAVVRRR